MNNKKQINNNIEKINLKLSADEYFCDVSKASREIMLDRICDGKEIEFPFNS